MIPYRLVGSGKARSYSGQRIPDVGGGEDLLHCYTTGHFTAAMPAHSVRHQVKVFPNAKRVLIA